MIFWASLEWKKKKKKKSGHFCWEFEFHFHPTLQISTLLCHFLSSFLSSSLGITNEHKSSKITPEVAFFWSV